jgi:hypothetical protein
MKKVNLSIWMNTKNGHLITYHSIGNLYRKTKKEKICTLHKELDEQTISLEEATEMLKAKSWKRITPSFITIKTEQ